MKITKFNLSLLISFLFSLVFCTLHNISFAQSPNELENDQFMFRGKFLAFSSYSVPSFSTDSTSFISLFKIPYDRLIFRKESINPKEIYFVANISAELTFQDNNGIIRSRQLIADSIKLKNFEETKSKIQFYTQSFYTTLKPEDYSAFLEIFDFNGKSLAKSRVPEIKFTNYYKTPTISDPFYLDSRIDNILIPFVSDSALNFKSQDPLLLFCISYKNQHNVIYIINKIEDDSEPLPWYESFSIKGTSPLIENKKVELSQNTNPISLLLTGTNDNSQKIPGANALSSIDSDSKGMNLGVFLISIPQDRFIPGKYEIIIKNPELKDSMRKIFYVKWESMPISLREVDNALNSMKIIIDDDQYDKLDKGNKKDVFNHILNYWKKFDPTPKTQFNEAMDEFFSRVDYVDINYRSIRERDGYKTERGKVYILNGKPDSIETIPTGSGTKENWIYKKIKKIYYFETNSAGLYKIIKIEDIVN